MFGGFIGIGIRRLSLLLVKLVECLESSLDEQPEPVELGQQCQQDIKVAGEGRPGQALEVADPPGGGVDFEEERVDGDTAKEEHRY